MPFHHPNLVSAPRRIDTAAFFDEVVPAALRARTEAARMFGFKLAIEVEGAGIWTIDFSLPEVRPNAAGQIDTLLSIGCADFEALIAGRLDAAAAWRDGKVLVAGDLRALEALTILLG